MHRHASSNARSVCSLVDELLNDQRRSTYTLPRLVALAQQSQDNAHAAYTAVWTRLQLHDSHVRH